MWTKIVLVFIFAGYVTANGEKEEVLKKFSDLIKSLEEEKRSTDGQPIAVGVPVKKNIAWNLGGKKRSIAWNLGADKRSIACCSDEKGLSYRT